MTETICLMCEAQPGDNEHCVWDGHAHSWHRHDDDRCSFRTIRVELQPADRHE